jgi:hypothetical protein
MFRPTYSSCHQAVQNHNLEIIFMKIGEISALQKKIAYIEINVYLSVGKATCKRKYTHVKEYFSILVRYLFSKAEISPICM